MKDGAQNCAELLAMNPNYKYWLQVAMKEAVQTAAPLNDATMQPMRLAIVMLLSIYAAAQSTIHVRLSATTESLRGVSAVSRTVVWASGTHGTYLRTTDGGNTWTADQVPAASSLDFRGVVAFSAREAFLMSSGPGDQSRIYHTGDGGHHWDLQFTNANPKGFFDSIAFWDSKHGIVLGDPIPDENGKLHFELLETEDGLNWKPLAPSRIPEAIAGEGAFAASNSCIALLRSEKRQIWFATGGKDARVFHSADGGRSWDAVETPIVHGPESAGIFSIAFRDASHGAIAGGDYKNAHADGPTLAFTFDGGKTWQLANIHPQAYFSAVAYGPDQHVFVVAQDFVLDVASAQEPRRWPLGKEPRALNAISVASGRAFLVGSKGLIASAAP